MDNKELIDKLKNIINEASEIDLLNDSNKIELIKNLLIDNKNDIKEEDNPGRIVLPDDMTEIPDSFYEGQIFLTEIVLPKNLKVIGRKAFKHTCLRKVIIPDSVVCIKTEAFENLPTLSEIHVIYMKVTNIISTKEKDKEDMKKQKETFTPSPCGVRETCDYDCNHCDVV